MLGLPIAAGFFFFGMASFLRWLGVSEDWSVTVATAIFTLWILTLGVVGFREMNGMSGVTSGKAVLSTVALAVGLAITAFIGAHFMSGRYESRPQAGGQQDFDVCTGKTENTPLEESIAACHRVVSKEVLDKKSIGEAYYTLAGGLDPTKAIGYLDQAIAQDPENSLYYGERGFQYYLLKDYDRALSEYEKALALNPDSSYAYGGRALTLEQKGDVAGALADLDRAIAIEPQEPVYYQWKAEIYLRQGATSEALTALEQGLKIKPDYADFYHGKAAVYRKIGDAEGELAALNRLIVLKPTDQYGLLLRALTYERLGRLDLAIADYDALLALDPDGKFYRERRAALLKARDDGAAPPVPAVVVGDAPGTSKEPARGAARLKKADRNAAPALECRVYVPGANLTVSVACAK